MKIEQGRPCDNLDGRLLVDAITSTVESFVNERIRGTAPRE